MTHHSHFPKNHAWNIVLVFALAVLCNPSYAEMKPKTYKVIDTQCDLSEQETAPSGQFEIGRAHV